MTKTAAEQLTLQKQIG